MSDEGRDGRTEGSWTPSAGSIYPTLQMLEDEGLISAQESDGKRRFTLTDEGRTEQESRAGERAPWDRVRDLLDETRRRIYAILAEES